jgi:hypothetical protein
VFSSIFHEALTKFKSKLVINLSRIFPFIYLYMYIPQDSSPQAQQSSQQPAAAAAAPAEQQPILSWTPTDPKKLKVDTFTATHFGLEQTDPWKGPTYKLSILADLVGLGVSGIGIYRNYNNSSAQAQLRRLDPDSRRLNKLLKSTSEALTSTHTKAKTAFDTAKQAISQDDSEALKLASHDEIASISEEGLTDELKPKIRALKIASQELSEASYLADSLHQGDIDFNNIANRQNLSDLTLLTQHSITVQLDNKNLGSQVRNLYAKDQAITEAALDLAEHSKLNWVEKLGKAKGLPVMGATISAVGLGYHLYDYFQDQDPEKRELDIKYDSTRSVLTVTAEDIGGKEKSVTDAYSLDNQGDISYNRYIDDEDVPTDYDINAIINLYINLANAHNKADDPEKPIIETQIKHIQDFINAHLDKKQAEPEDLLGFEKLTKLKNLPFERTQKAGGDEGTKNSSSNENARALLLRRLGSQSK